MAVRPILRMGDSFLAQTASVITEFDSPELDSLIEDMLDTMNAEEGAGLAAPQIGVGLRLIVFGFENNARYPEVEPVPRTILLNPVIKPLDETMEDGWEGCLSVPGLRGLVPRYSHIEYSGVNRAGQPIKVRATGFHARVVQHENDHLDGILYPQRIRDFAHFGYLDELTAAGMFL